MTNEEINKAFECLKLSSAHKTKIETFINNNSITREKINAVILFLLENKELISSNINIVPNINLLLTLNLDEIIIKISKMEKLMNEHLVKKMLKDEFIMFNETNIDIIEKNLKTLNSMNLDFNFFKNIYKRNFTLLINEFDDDLIKKLKVIAKVDYEKTNLNDFLRIDKNILLARYKYLRKTCDNNILSSDLLLDKESFFKKYNITDTKLLSLNKTKKIEKIDYNLEVLQFLKRRYCVKISKDELVIKIIDEIRKSELEFDEFMNRLEIYDNEFKQVLFKMIEKVKNDYNISKDISNRVIFEREADIRGLTLNLVKIIFEKDFNILELIEYINESDKTLLIRLRKIDPIYTSIDTSLIIYNLLNKNLKNYDISKYYELQAYLQNKVITYLKNDGALLEYETKEDILNRCIKIQLMGGFTCQKVSSTIKIVYNKIIPPETINKHFINSKNSPYFQFIKNVLSSNSRLPMLESEKIIKIEQLLSLGYSISEIAESFSYSETTIKELLGKKLNLKKV